MRPPVPAHARGSTDVLFAALFVLVALLPQLGLAIYALTRGALAAQAAAADVPQGLVQGLGHAMASCALLALLFLQLLRCVPVRLLIYGVVLGSTGLLLGYGFSLSFGYLAQEPGLSAFSQVLTSRSGDALLLGALLELLLVAWFWKELRLSVAVLRTTSAFLGDVPWLTLLYPPLFGLVHLAGLLLWSLATIGATELLQEEDGLGRTLRERYAVQSGLLLLLFYFWGNGLVTALSSLATASVTATWFFAPRSEKSRCASAARHCLAAVGQGLRFHGGSLAFGSLVLAAVRVLNVCLFWAGRNHARLPNDSNIRRCWLRLREAAAGCLEGAARLASRHAYVEVALSGRGFCVSARRAALRALEAPKRVTAVESAGVLYRSLAELLLMGLVGCGALGAAGGSEDADERPRALLSVLWACLGTWLVAESMLHPVSVATSTILHCFLLDGCKADTDHTPAPLKELLGVKDGDDDNAFAAHYA